MRIVVFGEGFLYDRIRNRVNYYFRDRCLDFLRCYNRRGGSLGALLEKRDAVSTCCTARVHISRHHSAQALVQDAFLGRASGGEEKSSMDKS